MRLRLYGAEARDVRVGREKQRERRCVKCSRAVPRHLFKTRQNRGPDSKIFPARNSLLRHRDAEIRTEVGLPTIRISTGPYTNLELGVRTKVIQATR
jgi:hypothetical protein